MGRKIPGRKHRGIRDPEKQHQERFEKLKSKINAPPVNSEEQQIPKSLQKLIDLKQRCKQTLGMPKKSKKKRKQLTFQPSKAGLQPKSNPIYTQAENETDRNFLSRVNEAVAEVLKEQSFEEKYNVKIQRNQSTGSVEKVIRRPKDELEAYADSLRKKGKKGKKSKKVETPKITKRQKQKEKVEAKKMLKQQNKTEDKSLVIHEHVRFGEVAHAPPTLTAPRRVEKRTPRPGTKELLLKNLLEDKPMKKDVIKNKTIDKKGKRKDLPNALRRQLEKQQSEVIEAYKNLKKQKY